MSAAPGGGTALADAGLQPERTLLAWRRTSASVAVAGAVVARAVAHAAPGTAAAGGAAPAVWCAVGGAVAAALTWLLATRRYRRPHRVPAARSSAWPADAGPAVLALAGALVVLAAAALVLVTALGPAAGAGS